MKNLMIKCLLIFLISCNVQSQEEKLIFNFIAACKDKNIEIPVIKDKYICEGKQHTEAKATLDKFLTDGIASIRKELQSKDLSKLKIIKATNDKEVQKEFVITDFSKVFILKENKKIVLYFLIENDRIAALSVLNKGGIKNFIILCN
ncbi:hypothetical protein [Flavobacterium sp. UGB4466]|uniref:hypothetical protein n=1 Tax=Flavobacterium sp. UGB4466 TaxID=2730889 RepID=UPI00192B3B53|nr:hypothetical protein [Flavobacterium sp. UGB4466]